MEGKRGSEYLLKSVSNIDFNPIWDSHDYGTAYPPAPHPDIHHVGSSNGPTLLQNHDFQRKPWNRTAPDQWFLHLMNSQSWRQIQLLRLPYCVGWAGCRAAGDWQSGLQRDGSCWSNKMRITPSRIAFFSVNVAPASMNSLMKRKSRRMYWSELWSACGQNHVSI